MKRTIRFTMQSVILLYTVPTLALITGFYAWTVYAHVYETILAGFDRKLYAASTTTAAFIDGDEHNKILTDFKSNTGVENGESKAINEETARYRDYATPMKRVLEQLGLSYHYTVIPRENNHITYVLDATDGEKHSVAGSDEENPAAEAQRLLEVMKTGKASLSDIQELDVWGLLKVGTAPILNSSGEIKAVVGADVDISVIGKKTRNALFLVMSLGAASLILAVLTSFIVARKLTDPIRVIKEAALRVAAGKFDAAIIIRGPQELAQLSITFNGAAETLRWSVERLEAANETSEKTIQRAQVLQLFQNGIQGARSQGIATIGSSLYQLYPALGWVEDKGRFLLWLAGEGSDPLINAKLRSDIEVLSSKLISTYASDKEALAKQLGALSHEAIDLLLLFDQKQGSVCCPIYKDACSAVVSDSTMHKEFKIIELESLSIGAGSKISVSPQNSKSSGARATDYSITFVHGVL